MSTPYRAFALIACRECYYCGKTIFAPGPLWCDAPCKKAFLATWPATWFTSDPLFVRP
jgi:hypothetical protein